MTTEYYDVDDYEQNGNANDSKLLKDLRTQIKKANEDLKAAQQTIADQSKTIRERTVSDVLSTKGVPSKVAKLIPADIEASEDAVSKWLEDFGDLFAKPESGGQQNQQQDAGGSETQVQQEAATAQRIQSTMQGGTAVQPRLDELINQVQNADATQLLAMIQASKNGGT